MNAAALINIDQCQATAAELDGLLKASVDSCLPFVSAIYVFGMESSVLTCVTDNDSVQCVAQPWSKIDAEQFCKEEGVGAGILLNLGEQLIRQSSQSLSAELASQRAALRIQIDDHLGTCRWEPRVIRPCARSASSEPDTNVDTEVDSKHVEPTDIYSVCIKSDLNPAVQISRAASYVLHHLDSESSNTAIELARAFETLDDMSSAKAWYQHVVKGSASDVRRVDLWYAEYRLQWFSLHQDGLTSENFQAACQLFDDYPERSEPLVNMAAYLRSIGEIDQALAILDQAKAAPEPNDDGYFFKIHYHRAVHLERAECYALKAQWRQVYRLASREQVHSEMHPNRNRLIALRDQAYLKLKPVFPTSQTRRNHFLIIVPFYNAVEFLQACVDSIAQQDYTDYHVAFVDDMSTDGGLTSINLTGLASYRVVMNEQRFDGLGNQLRVMDAHPEPDDIAVLLDGDDALAHPHVLSRLNDLYNDSGCWLTWGQHQTAGGGISQTRPVLRPETVENIFKHVPFLFPIHLRTNRVGLFQKIKEQSENYHCLNDESGQIMSHAGDIASMRAMLSMAELDRVRYVPEILHDYNIANPESHHHIASDLQSKNAVYAAQQPLLEQVHTYLPGSSAAAPNAGLLLVCLSGGDPIVIDQLIEQGKLPNFSKLLGHSQKLDIPHGFGNDSFWRAVMAGKLPGGHYMSDRRVSRLNSYRLDDAQIDEWVGTVQPFWTDIAIDGCQVAALNVPEVKLHRVSNVTALSDWFTHGPDWSPGCAPENLIGELDRSLNVDVDDYKSVESSTFLSEDDFLPCYEKVERRHAYKQSAYKALLSRGDWGLFIAGFDFCHDISHQCWHFHDESHPLHSKLKSGDPVESMYEVLDNDIGDLINTAGDTAVAVVAGLGFQKNCSLNSILSAILIQLEKHYLEQGYLQQRNLQNSDISADNAKQRSGLSDPSSDHHRLFYAVNSNPNAGALRVNLQGREPNGLVAPSDYASLITRLKADLIAINSTISAKPMLSSVVEVAEEYPGPYSGLLPDLMLVWNVDAALETYASDLVNDVVFQPNPNNILDFRTGDHSDNASIYFNDVFAEYLDTEGVMPCQQLSETFKTVALDRLQHKQEQD